MRFARTAGALPIETERLEGVTRSTPIAQAPAARRFLPGLSARNVVRELLAGVTLLALSVPLNIGYAQIAGLPPTAGLVALILPAITFAVLTSSRQLVVAPDAAAAALVASSLAGTAAAGSGNYMVMAAAQAIVCGVILLVAAVFKLGFIADFLSKPILIGFVGGLAFDVTLSQAGKMLGLSVPHGDEFVHRLVGLIAQLGDTHVWSLVLSVASLAVIVCGRMLSRRVPWALIVMVAATVVSVLWNFSSLGVAVLGTVPGGFPTLSVPMLELGEWLTLLPSALALAAVAMAEGLMLARSYAEKNDYPQHPNRDLAALGLANVAAGVSGSFSVGSSTSRTAAMDDAGSRTQLPSLVLAVGALLLLLFGTALLAPIPQPVIGAVVIVAVSRLIGIGEFRHLWRRSRAEFSIAAICFAGVLVLGPVQGLLLAFVLTLVDLTQRASRARLVVLSHAAGPGESLLDATEEGETAPGIVVLRFTGPVFFANATAISGQIRALPDNASQPLRAAVFDVGALTDLDTRGSERLEAALKSLGERGVELAVTRLHPAARELLNRADLTHYFREFPTNREAVATLQETHSD